MQNETKDIAFNIGSQMHKGTLVDGGPNGGVVLYPDWEGCRTAYALRKAEQLAVRLACKVLVTDMYGMDGQPKAFSGDADVRMQRLLADPAALRATLAAAAPVYAGLLDVQARHLHVVGTCFGGALAFEYGRSGAPVATLTCIHGDPSTTLPSRAFLPASFLLVHGAADPLIGGDRLNAFFSEMGAHGTDWQTVLMGNVKHSFTKEEVGGMNQSLRYDSRATARAFEQVAALIGEARA